MNVFINKIQEYKSKTITNDFHQKKKGDESTFQFIDNRPEAIAQIKLQEMANNSSQVKQVAQRLSMAENYSTQQQKPTQKKGIKQACQTT